MDFTTDWEKMYDFWRLTKADFLNSYSYLTEAEYDATCIVTLNKTIEHNTMPTREEEV